MVPLFYCSNQLFRLLYSFFEAQFFDVGADAVQVFFKIDACVFGDYTVSFVFFLALHAAYISQT